MEISIFPSLALTEILQCVDIYSDDVWLNDTPISLRFNNANYQSST